MKYLIICIIILSSCGTTGHVMFYNFEINKYEVEREIMRVINNDSSYIIPRKWTRVTKGDCFKRIYVYFNTGPEEVYQLGFTGDSINWAQNSSSRLGLISIYQGNQFKYENELSNKEVVRIQKRLEELILSKLKYSYYKSH